MGSSYILADRHPPVLISPANLWGLLGLEVLATQVPCPGCSRAAQRITAPDGFWIVCPESSCGWSGDHFEYFQARSGLDSVSSALDVLSRRDVPVPASCRNPAVIRSYQKRVRARKRFRQLQLEMEGRTGTAVPDDVFTALGLTPSEQHNPPDWWHTTVGELDMLLGEDAYPTAAEARRLGLKPGNDHRGALVIPTYDTVGRISGVWAAAALKPQAGAPQPDWRWRGLLDVPGSISLARGMSNDVASWGQSGLLLTDPSLVIRLHVERQRHGATAPPAVLLPPDESLDPTATALRLPTRNWTLVIPKDLNPKSARLFRIAACLRAKVRLLGGDTILERTVSEMATQVIGRADWWGLRLGELLDQQTASPRVAAFLQSMNWSEEMTDRLMVNGFLTLSAAAVIRESLAQTSVGRSVPVRTGMTILDTADGWVWVERGLLVASAVPDRIHAYLGPRNRVRHRGVIRYRGDGYEFDSGRFRLNPAAIIETVLLRAGVRHVPPPDVRILDRMVDIALILSEVSTVRSPSRP